MSANPYPPELSVFLNFPFDKGYEPLFLALIASLVSIGRRPRCVLEIAEHGQGRLPRIMALMESCRVSIHDLSRVGGPRRFNMPFELGLAHALRAYRSQGHLIVMLENEPHCLSKILSDMAGFDPLAHRGKPLSIIRCVLDALGTGERDPSTRQVYAIWRRLMGAARTLKSLEGEKTVFSRTLFKRVVSSAIRLSARAELIPQ